MQKRWKLIHPTNPVKLTYKVIEEEGGKPGKLIAGEIPEKSIAELIENIPNFLEAVEIVISCIEEEYKKDYLSSVPNDDMIHLYKYIHFVKKQTEKFKKAAGSGNLNSLIKKYKIEI